MIRTVLILLAVMAVLPAGADARHGKKRRAVKMAKVHAGRASAPVGWARLPLSPPAVAPAPTAAPTPPAPAAEPVGTATPTPVPTTVPGDNPHSVSVRSTEFRFSLSQPSVEAGTVRVQFDNSRAEDPHALAYTGPTADAFESVDPGAVVKYTVTLTPGSYRLYCPLPEHETLGMRATLTVR